MRVSLNTIKQYVDFELPPTDDLVDSINRQLGGVEEIIDLSAKYKDARIVRIVEAVQHPNADRLRVCKIDDNHAVTDVPRDDDGYIQVVCGAPNAVEGMVAIWLPPSSTVPASFDEESRFVLSARELRGVLSQGMLAAADELAIGTDHEGIIEIAKQELAPHETRDISDLIGESFAEVFGLNDTVIDIENKMFTHRPDLFGQLGVAREVAGIQHHTFVSPDWYKDIPQFDNAKLIDLEVFNEVPDQAPRFTTVAVKDVEVKPSPLWLQCELVRLGGKPINNIVDITNYIMLLTAQPTHAYDYAKLRGAKLGVRMAVDNERITLLNGKQYQLTPDDVVIVDAEGPVGLAGIMGGSDSEVDSSTKDIVLEVANFDMYTLRKSAMRHGVFTDALTRFNKGQSPLQNDRVIKALLGFILDYTGGSQASDVADIRSARVEGAYTSQTLESSQTITAEFINERLGLSLSVDEVATLLTSVEFSVVSRDDTLTITAPFWRTDIELPEDIVEEVGRLYGYDHLPRQLAQRNTKPTATNEYRELAEKVRQSLARAGANEVLTYSFVHERVLVRAEQDPSDAYHLSNALSPDLQYYRLSLTPSLLDKVNGNIRTGFDEFALFEIGKSHSKKAGLDDEGLPVEPRRIALTYAAKVAKEGAAYYQVKRLLDFMAESLGLHLDYKPLALGNSSIVAAAPFADGRTARAIDRASGQVIGIIGEYKASVKKAFKVPNYSAGFELFTEGILLAQKSVKNGYQPLSKYPSIERDVCFEVKSAITYDDVIQSTDRQLSNIEIQSSIEPIDIYQSKDAQKRVTIRIRLTPYDATMTNDEANKIIDDVSQQVASEIGATII